MTASATGAAISAPQRLYGRLWHNTGWNLCGTVLPMTIGVFVLPRLVERFGAGRFGILAIAWALVGYLSLFDFGLGRTLTKLVAERLGCGDTDAIPALWSGALALITAQGVIGGGLLAAISPWLANSVLKLPGELQAEALRSLLVVALMVPVVTSSAGLRGFLEAHCAFPALNTVKIFLGISGFLGPLIVIGFSRNVSYAILTLFAGRLGAWYAYWVLCRRLTATPFRLLLLSRSELMSLLRFGGWMTVSNVVSPMMNSLDTFLVGALVSVSQIQYYSIPAEAVTKGLLIPSSLAAALFPVFSALFAADRSRAEYIYAQSILLLSVCLAPFVVGCVLLAKPGLSLWMGAEFAGRSYRVAQVIAAGVFMNGIASVPFAYSAGIRAPRHHGEAASHRASVLRRLRVCADIQVGHRRHCRSVVGENHHGRGPAAHLFPDSHPPGLRVPA